MDMIVFYCFDTNYIHIKAMPSRIGYQILLTYQQAHKMLVARGLQPSLQCLDNELSVALIASLDKEQVKFQLTPASIHHRNFAESAIRTWKNHFLAILGGTAPPVSTPPSSHIVKCPEHLTLTAFPSHSLAPK